MTNENNSVMPPMFRDMSDRSKRIAVYLLQDQAIAGLREYPEEDRARLFDDLKSAMQRNDMDAALSTLLYCARTTIKPAEIELAKMVATMDPKDITPEVAVMLRVMLA